MNIYQTIRLIGLGVVIALMSVGCSDSQPRPVTDVSTSAQQPVENPDSLPSAPDRAAPLSDTVAAPSPAPVSTPAPVETPTPVVAPPPPATFSLQVAVSVTTLTEGDANGLAVPVTVTRNNGHTRAVELRVDPDSFAQNSSLTWRYSQPVLTNTESVSELLFNLPVSVAPIQPQSFNVRIIASDGDSEQSQQLEITVIPVPAPDIYLLIGQSNMVGSSFEGVRNISPGGSDELNNRIRQLNVRQNSETLFSTTERFTDPVFNVLEPTFVIAEDPLHEPHFPGQDGKEGSHIGLGLSFAKGMLPHTTQTIVLVPAAWSSSGFCRGANPELSWNVSDRPGSAFGSTRLLDRAMTRLNLALRESGGIFRGILWHQGEADSNNSICAEAYEENLANMVAFIRRNAAVDRRGTEARGDSAAIPFVLATMSRGDDLRGEFSEFSPTKLVVDRAHRTIESRVPLAIHVNTDDLVPPAFPCGESSCVHFGATALRELGFRYHTGMRNLQQP